MGLALLGIGGLLWAVVRPGPLGDVGQAATIASPAPSLPPTARATRPPAATTSATSARPVVFLDPGHGGSDVGGFSERVGGEAVVERSVDLDIALRAAAILRGDGLTVVLSRSSDAESPSLKQRMDAANASAASVFVSIHNNSVPGGVGRTEDFYCGRECELATESRALAAAILSAHLRELRPFEGAAWQVNAPPAPIDDWVRWADDPGKPEDKARHFYLLGPYSASYRPRPLLMPAALVESLSGSNPTELAMLGDAAVRAALARAYATGIETYLAGRTMAGRFELAGPLTAQRSGSPSEVDVTLANTGSTAFPAGAVLFVDQASPEAEFQAGAGEALGSLSLPAPLPPGGRATYRVPVLPTDAGTFVWKADLLVGARLLSQAGTPWLHLPVIVR